MAHITQILFMFLPLSYALFVIPIPNGTYGVHTAQIALTDTLRVDPSVLISAFSPIALRKDCQWRLTPYMPDGTAAFYDHDFGVPKGTIESGRLQMCSPGSSHQPYQATGLLLQNFPLVLFSPGADSSRLLSSAIAQTVASHGYIVVTIDHPYDAAIVQFPDGRLVLGSTQLNTSDFPTMVKTRAKDVSFVLDELERVDVVRRLLPQYHSSSRLDTRQVAMWGHSLGGAATASAMAIDKRIVGGLNLDGPMFGPVLSNGLGSPFILFGSDPAFHGGKDSKASWVAMLASWTQIWPHLSWKLDLMLKSSGHGTFQDLPLLARLLYGNGKLPQEIVGNIGTLPSDRAMKIVTTYVTAFMDMVLKCAPQALLQRPSELFPEVVFIAK
ncbi:hypothetical protein LTR97_012571 [Elasticomyces elasticus]|uniref:1-alkyl-2-acetylglycerophosphocholine esterase n=1 Tax=Elasticomyces elasticus TaxID=574655 RepID=A0AAN7VKQ3_9PEZI|nr:hypothetical protein LTR97_012571 [Elasticomyces elasticus]